MNSTVIMDNQNFVLIKEIEDDARIILPKNPYKGRMVVIKKASHSPYKIEVVAPGTLIDDGECFIISRPYSSVTLIYMHDAWHVI